MFYFELSDPVVYIIYRNMLMTMLILLYHVPLLERGTAHCLFIQAFRPSEVYFILIGLHCFGSRASEYGLVKFDSSGRVIQFSEKPKGADLEAMVSSHLSLHIQIYVYTNRFAEYLKLKTLIIAESGYQLSQFCHR